MTRTGVVADSTAPMVHDKSARQQQKSELILTVTHQFIGQVRPDLQLHAADNEYEAVQRIKDLQCYRCCNCMGLIYIIKGMLANKLNLAGK